MSYPISEFKYKFLMSFLEDRNKNAYSFIFKSIFIETKHLVLTLLILKVFLLKLCNEKSYEFKI